MNKALVLVVVAACVPPVPSEGIRSTIDITPKTPPAVIGGYEFELLDAVDGTACVVPTDTMTPFASIPGFTPTQSGDVFERRAEGAAVYDAMSKAQGADTLLITWVKVTTNGNKRCATVHARGVRIRQAGTPPESPSVAPASSAPGA
jgi:hypothetical protein